MHCPFQINPQHLSRIKIWALTSILHSQTLHFFLLCHSLKDLLKCFGSLSRCIVHIGFSLNFSQFLQAPSDTVKFSPCTPPLEIKLVLSLSNNSTLDSTIESKAQCSRSPGLCLGVLLQTLVLPCFYAFPSAPVIAVAIGSVFLGCPSIPFSWTQYLRIWSQNQTCTMLAVLRV